MRSTVLALLSIAAIGAPLISAQTAGRAFDVASIREARPPMEYIQSDQFHVGMNINASRAEYGFMSLADLIPYAYRVKPYQVFGPSWMNDTRWDIAANIPQGQPTDRVPDMMQNLLAERFKLSIHRERREQPVYALVVGTGGLKIAEAAAGDEAGVGGPLNVRINNSDIAISGGATGAMRFTPASNGGLQMQMTKVTMAALADRLTQFMDRSVMDATKLNGTYRVALNLPVEAMTGMSFPQKLAAVAGLGSFGMAAGASAPGTLGAAMFQAVKDLGLELQSRKAPVDTIIVDRLAKTPTPN